MSYPLIYSRLYHVSKTPSIYKKYIYTYGQRVYNIDKKEPRIMKRKGFTLIEILISITVLIILASISLYTWTGVVDKVKQRVCEQNQLIIQEALWLYIYKNDAVPTSLSQVEPYTDTAIAHLEKNKPQMFAMRKLYLALIRMDEAKNAIAGEFSRYTGGSYVLRCPAKIGEGISYGFNDRLLAKDSRPIDLLGELSSKNIPVICDCDNPTFFADNAAGLKGGAFRHGRKFLGEPTLVATSADRVFVVSDKNKIIKETKKGAVSSSKGKIKEKSKGHR
jgi:prepilin-type N-terminal cleavage/methylation domain-containing protein